MFYKHSNEGNVAILTVYINDIILTRDDNIDLERLKKSLANDYEVKDLVSLKYFFWYRVCQVKKEIFVHNKNMYLTYLGKQVYYGVK